MDQSAAAPVLDLKQVSMTFAKAAGDPLKVLDKVDITLKDGEILGLLGRSGSGKSTLLRIAAGLVTPTEGAADFLGRPITGPSEGVGMVFQTFALFPWLTVMQNVEAALDALGVKRGEARARATEAINLIGLNGFEQAYPRELSGGMRQRVGFARATVIRPTMLLMDEPFSALDVLTAETLRTDFLDLWSGRQLPTKSVLIVTHNIEEAVLMCDRVLVLSSNPGRIGLDIPVSLPKPRNRLDSAFRDLVDEIYSTLTARAVESIRAHHDVHGGIAQPLPMVQPHELEVLADALASPAFGGKADLAKLAGALSRRPLDILPAAEALHILEFAELKDGGVSLTAAGRVFAQSQRDARKPLLAEHLVRFLPLMTHVMRILDERAEHCAPVQRFRDELEDHLSREASDQTLHTLVAWARFAGVLAYDHKTRTITALSPEPAPAGK